MGKILLVDENFREGLVSGLVSKLGHNYDIAKSNQELTKLVTTVPYSLILSTLFLGLDNVFSNAQSSRTNSVVNTNTPFVVHTFSPNPTLVQEASKYDVEVIGHDKDSIGAVIRRYI
ncbi:MAG: hypothetical protein ABIH82_05080 [Candidatus Woesearchaeota archaeon]